MFYAIIRQNIAPKRITVRYCVIKPDNKSKNKIEQLIARRLLTTRYGRISVKVLRYSICKRANTTTCSEKRFYC